MFALRKVKALVSGQATDSNDEVAHLRDVLETSSVPITTPGVDCRMCSNPCHDGHEEYPSRFHVDHSSKMLGTVKPYCRQVVISTGKSDWDRKIAHTTGSLASYFQQIRKTPASDAPDPEKQQTMTAGPHVNGLFTSSDTSRVSVLNGNHRTISDNEDLETLFIFPDYKMVSNVERTLDGAREFRDTFLSDRSSTVTKKSSFSSWVIPYSCVILLCSHKKRDNRCWIAAEKLAHAFSHCLQEKGWQVDTHLEHPTDAPLEQYLGTEIEREARVLEQLHQVSQEKTALIVKTSHTKGHRYAGNCIIYTPKGAGVWYGRVSAHEVSAIVTHTILDGNFLPSLLRGGINLSRTS